MLIFPPSSLNGVGMESSFIPNGLLSIAGYLKVHLPEIDVKVVDGSVSNIDEIISEIKDFVPDVVGLSILLGNYKNAKALLKEAKKIGAKTILGNHHAKYLITLLRRSSSCRIDNVDYLINGKRGEVTFFKLIQSINQGIPSTSIPQVGIVEGGKFLFNREPIKHPKISDRISPDISFISDFSKYFKAYNRVFKNFHDNTDIRPININFIEGCYQGCKQPCVYCCLKDHQIDFLNPEEYWEKISELVNKGFNYFFETCNSLSSLQYVKSNGANYLENLSNSMPSDLKGKMNMMVYANANEINDKTLKVFKEIGVHRVIFGFDSGDNSVLNNGIGKQNIKINNNIEVASLLNNEGIQTYACYVPGSSTETKESLENTYTQIKKLLSLKNTSVIEFTSLAPMPGSRAWQQIKDDYEKQFGISDYINITDLAKTWVDLKAKNISWELIQEYKHKIKNQTILNNKIFGGYY